MPTPRDLSIVLGPSPSRKNPIQYGQLEALATRRTDVALRTATTGTRERQDIVLVDPTGRVPGELLFIDGRLQIRDPGEVTLEWMLELANELGGRVKDNTLRTYKSARETYRHPEDRDGRARLGEAIRDARKIDRSPGRKRGAYALLLLLLTVAIGAYLLRNLSRG